MKNKGLATFFAIVLGGLGLHKFYLGRTFRGLLYLGFCWTFIPAILGFFEGIVYAMMSEKDFQNKYKV